MLCFSLLSLSCSKTPPSDARQLPLPTAEKIAIVDGIPFTITDLINIRKQLRDPSSETAYWIGVGSLAIRKEAANQGKTLSLLESTRLSRYAMNDLSLVEVEPELRLFYPKKRQLPTPAEVKEAINRLIEKAWIQRGLLPLSHL